MVSLTVIILSVVIFSALVINMALKPAYSARLTAVLMTIAALGGSVIYGLGYTHSGYGIILSLIRTPFSVIGMFLGKNDLSAINGAEVVATTAGKLVFWTLHLLAFYSIASAAMISIGAEGLRRLRLLLAMNGDLTIIYGINDESLKVGKECIEKKKSAVVFIADQGAASAANNIAGLGMAVLSGSSAANSELSELKWLRIEARRKIEVFALDEDANKDLFYVLRLRDAFEKIGVDPKKTSVTLPGTEEILMEMLQVSPDHYGFGYVNVYDPADLMARAMIKLCPPWEFMTFDNCGCAQQDFDCIVVGFGYSGQAALRYLIMNSQFVGSSFHAAVFSTDFDKQSGFLFSESPEILEKYDIEVFKNDARSKEFYQYLNTRLGSLRYIAVCAGTDEMNSELTDHIMLYLQRLRAEHICVVQCTKDGVRYQQAVGRPIQSRSVRSLEMLSAEILDRDAILINSAYDSSDKTDWEKWVLCNSFGKMSSRASAEFIPALVRASGDTPEEIIGGKWDHNEDLKEILGETEHLRWCAFHYCMGYRTMSDKEFESNVKEYIRCREKGLPLPRITKNTERRTHACLIPYHDLDDLSAKENAVTGRNTDYKKMDIANVMMIPNILKRNAEEQT